MTDLIRSDRGWVEDQLGIVGASDLDLLASVGTNQMHRSRLEQPDERNIRVTQTLRERTGVVPKLMLDTQLRIGDGQRCPGCSVGAFVHEQHSTVQGRISDCGGCDPQRGELRHSRHARLELADRDRCCLRFSRRRSGRHTRLALLRCRRHHRFRCHFRRPRRLSQISETVVAARA
jgi:hypothetical protein